MKLGLIQTDLAWNDPESNIGRFRELVSQAVHAKAEFIMLPEMFSTGFSRLSGAPAREAGLKARDFLKQQASFHKVYLCGSYPWAVDGDFDRPFNTLGLYGPTGLLGEYAKLHLFSYGGEGECYRAGSATFTTDVLGWRVTFFICYDLRFPLPFYESAPQTDLYVVVANWPTARRAHWTTLLRAREIEKQAFCIGINRIGEGGELRYSGDSQVIDPSGEILLDASSGDGVFMIEIDRARVEKLRQSFPVLSDRRKDMGLIQ